MIHETLLCLACVFAGWAAAHAFAKWREERAQRKWLDAMATIYAVQRHKGESNAALRRRIRGVHEGVTKRVIDRGLQ